MALAARKGKEAALSEFGTGKTRFLITVGSICPTPIFGIWESEQHSMAIFEAATLALVHYEALRPPAAAQLHQVMLS